MRTAVTGLTQIKAAKIAGISRCQWNRMEKGLHRPRPHKIPAIANAIRTDIEALYRKAGLEVPRKYAKYDMEAAKREFGFALQESTSFQDFINRMQLIWQKYQQDETGKRQPFYLDHAQTLLLDLIYRSMTGPQRIRLAHAIVQDLKRTDVKAVITNAQQFFDNLDMKMEELHNAR
jgi:transcriptional regulator with XRE-family HTH domain